MMRDGHYATLGVDASASPAEVKRAYFALCLQHHPDKQKSAEMAGGGLVFHRINAAWECLRDEGRRRDYDRQLRASQSRQRGIVDDEVDLDSMDFDSEALTYSYPCRCSGSYTISEDDLEAGREMAPCTDCSLKVVVLYDVVDDDNEDNATGPDQNTTTASSHIAL